MTRGTADARSDIYSLGIMLYEMLTGEQPYKGEQPMQIAFQHATDSVPRPSVKNPGVPEELDELVLWATAKSPDDRPADAPVMLDRLREIERDLGITPVVTRTVPKGVARDEGQASGDATQVLPTTGTGPTAPVDASDNAGRLRTATKRRAHKGGWLLAVVLLLAALAVAAGWWFGSGPGSQVQVPDVTGLSFAEASDRLVKDALIAVEKGENSLDVPLGEVVRTDPASGASVDKDTTVDVYVSRGPAEATIPALAGMSAAQARELLSANFITVPEETDRVFSADVAVDIVISASVLPAAGGDPIDCTAECIVHQGDTAMLLVSAGAIPSVSGLSVGDATAALNDVTLSVATESQTEYSDDIDKDRVIRIADPGRPIKPGETVTLVVSQGPKPIAVPNVRGRSVAEAVEILEDAGFEPTTNVPEFVWGLFTATSTDPEAGSLQVRGTKVHISASG